MPFRVLIAGGGIAAAETVLALRDLAGDAVSITLLSPDDELVYRPLSVTAPFGGETPRGRTMVELAAEFDVRLVKGSLAWVAPSAHRAYTDGGLELAYDALVVAIGARRVPAFEHALTFRGYEDSGEMRDVVEAAASGEVDSVAFVVPDGTTWPLPLYELALMTAARAAEQHRSDLTLTIVTPEPAPLALFGDEASAEVSMLLAAGGIECEADAVAEVPGPGTVVLDGRGELVCDRVVALPRIVGPAIKGLPSDEHGFLRATSFGHVIGVKDVFAAGDATSFPIKQGGVACQQADVVAEAIAHRAGAPITPSGYRPVLRGTLLTGDGPRWLRSNPGDRRGRGKGNTVADHVLWWPPGKVAGNYLARYLGELGAIEPPPVKGRAVISRGRDHGEVALSAR